MSLHLCNSQLGLESSTVVGLSEISSSLSDFLTQKPKREFSFFEGSSERQL